MARTILHLDLDAFFCAVEEQRDPTLRGRPFAVGGRPESRGVVCSCSYPARRFGVRSAMSMARAQRLCPHLVIVPTHFPAYREASAQVMARLHAVTPRIEQISIDEAFLDVTELNEPGESVARRLQAVIRHELSLPCSLGVATNKLVAKIASDTGKAASRSSTTPNAICVVPPGQEAAFLAPLPASALWGVGPRTAERLATLGITTIGDLARRDERDLVRRFGKAGLELSRHARGVDERELATDRATRSISRETTFASDVADLALLRRTLHEQATAVARSLRRERLRAATVKVKLRWPDFTTVTRQMSLSHPTDDAAAIATTAARLFTQCWPVDQPVRLLGVGVSGLDGTRQLSLWEQSEAPRRPDPEKRRRMQTAVASLRHRFGDGVVRLGNETAS